MSAVFRLVFPFFLIAVLAGCSTPPPGNSFPQQTWAHKPPLALLVGDVVVERRYRDRGDLPHVETQAPRSPAAEMENWTRRRLVAAGSGGQARLVILQAPILQSLRPVEESAFPLFGDNKPGKRLEGTLSVELVVTSTSGAVVGRVQAQANQITTLPSDTTLNEREQALFELVEALLVSMDTEMERQIRLHLRDYLVGG